MDQLSKQITENSGIVTASLGVVVLILLLLVFSLMITVRSLKKRYAFLLRNEQTQDLGEIFASHDKQLQQLSTAAQVMGVNLESLTRRVEDCIQGVGVVRFDAFDDIGGQQSYAVALLDQKDDGVVFSSLLSRNDSRTYAKQIKNGKAAANLSAEEEQAVVLARQTGKQAAELVH